VSKIAQALATAGRGVAVLTDEPAYALHPVEIVGRGGSLQIRLHAAWNPSHYAVESIRSLVEALAAFAAPVRSP
jgi:DNA-binding transcriptional LysR family regulator